MSHLVSFLYDTARWRERERGGGEGENKNQKRLNFQFTSWKDLILQLSVCADILVTQLKFSTVVCTI